MILDYGQYYINAIFYAPLGLAAFLYVLWTLAGPDLLWGLAVSAFCLLSAPAFSKCAKKLKAASAAVTDHRLQLLYDTVEGIRVIKAHAWEAHTLAAVSQLRRQ